MSNVTHIICILDRSGSMQNQASEVITNFNHFLSEQQSVEGEAKLTLVLFDDKYEMVYDQIDIRNVPPLTAGTYFVRGTTAMNDAIGRTLNAMQRNEKAIVLIHTDGYENASKEYNPGQVKTLVDMLKKKWEFIFVGGDINAKAVSADLGIARSMKVTNDAIGNAMTYAAFSASTVAYRSGGLDESAKVDIKDDVSDVKTNTVDLGNLWN